MAFVSRLRSALGPVWRSARCRDACREGSSVACGSSMRSDALLSEASFSVAPPVPPGNAAPACHARGFQTSSTRPALAQNTAMDIFDRCAL